jgi:HlyB family type I secretion system ABC transporter/HlyD family type I secretion membrane fusion protein
MVTAPRLDDLLRCFPFLADQPPDLLLRLSADAELQRFQQGQPICRTDHPPARIFLLLEGTARSVLLGIPAVGNQEFSLADFREQWGEAGDVLTLRVNDMTPRRRFGFRWFLPALRQHRTVLMEVLLASFFVQLFGLVNPLLIQQVIDKVIINHSPSALGVLGVLLVVFALFEGLLLCLRTFLFVDTTNRIDLSLGTQIIDHLLRLPLSYFDRRPVGEVSSRIGELEKVRGFLTGTALTTILDAIFSVLYIGVMLIYSWQLTLLTLAVVPFLVLLVLVVSPIVQVQLQSRAVAHARTQSHLVEVLSSMMTVKAQNIELRSRWKWQDLYTDDVADGFDNTLVSTTASSISGFLNKLSGLIVIWAGAGMVLSGALSLGELIAFRIIAGYVTGPLLRMTSIWQSVQETALSLERLSDVIDHPQEAPDDNARRLVMPPIQGEIRFRNISFRYKPSSPLLLKNLNLTIPRGTFVAIVGTSGSGKSTLTKLLARLYAPEEGVVLVDGIDVAKVELHSLRHQLGIVPQDTVLSDGSVEENITLTNPEASTEEVIEAARIAAAHDFIMELPAGYSTEVGERGSSLSGGQRQRIAIARTILQKPRLLIMDEATSALDYQTERVVSENLMQALQGCTVLFITHRLSSIVKADMIVCMGQGAVLEVGRHEELMRARRTATLAAERKPAEPTPAEEAPLPLVRLSRQRRRTHLPRSTRGWSRAIIWSLIGLTGFGVIYGAVARIDSSISTTGKLRPIGGTLDVLPPFPAPIRQVLVRDGQSVAAGQVLVEFDAREAWRERRALRLQADLWRRQVNQAARQLGLPSLPGDSKEERQVLALERKDIQLRHRVALQRLRRSEAGQREQLEVLAAFRARYALNANIRQRMAQLAREGAISHLELERQDERQLDLLSTIRRTEQQLDAAGSGVVESLTNQEQVATDNDRRLWDRYDEARHRLLETSTRLSQVEERLRLGQVVAPRSGRVFDLQARSGEISTPGRPLLRLVPQGGLEAELAISNRDIAFLRPGMAVDVRVTSLPFTDYGSLQGTVVRVGADALPPDPRSGEESFPVLVRLDQMDLSRNGRRFPLQAGMAVTGLVQLGNRPVLALLNDRFGGFLEGTRTMR